MAGASAISAFAVLGKVLGYPECCTMAYEVRCVGKKMAPTELARQAMRKAPQHCRYHWIPCEKCAQLIVRGEVSFESLLTWKRPLIDLTAKLSLPQVREHAEAVLNEEEYAVYEQMKISGIGNSLQAQATETHMPGLDEATKRFQGELAGKKVNKSVSKGNSPQAPALVRKQRK